jgi:hypothetical protein
MNHTIAKEIAISLIISKIVEIQSTCHKTTTHLTKQNYLITVDLNHWLHHPTLQLIIHHLQTNKGCCQLLIYIHSFQGGTFFFEYVNNLFFAEA